MIRPELGILADDLTGATDTGLQFAKRGRRTCVALTWPTSPAGDVLVVDLDSRSRSATEARDRTISATRALASGGVSKLYKKIDSTGRGNLGAEIDGMMLEYPCTAALVCPAFPQLGRTVRDGRIFVQGVSLELTEFAADPLWPATTASLASIIARQSVWPSELIGLADVHRGPVAVRTSLRDVIRRGTRIVLADAESVADLQCLTETMRQMDSRILPVGSAGLAEWLAGSLDRPARSSRPVALANGPILIVAGTMNQVGLGQLSHLAAGGAALVALDLERALDDPIEAGDRVAPDVIRQLWTVATVVVSLVDPRKAVPDLRSAMDSRNLTPAFVTDRLVQGLARAAERAMGAVAPAALVLTGGDTARAVCAAIGIQALEIVREVAPGIPVSLLQGGRWDGLPVVTKAGGFGDSETLARVIQMLEGMRT